MAATITCQEIFDSSAIYTELFASTDDWSNSDPISYDVTFKMTGSINNLLNDQKFGCIHNPPTATEPNQFEFQGAPAAWTKLHKQLWNSGLTNSTSDANGLSGTYTYLTTAPDGNNSNITTWNHAWGILVGYSLNSSDSNGALIKASAIETAVGDSGYSSSLLTTLYSAFQNVSTGPTAIVPLNASTNFLDALMIHVYGNYSNPSRLSGDPSHEFVTISLQEDDEVSFFMKCTPVNSLNGSTRYMKIILKQGAS